MKTSGNIRLAEQKDIKEIVEIYNQGIRNRNNAILDEIDLKKYKKEFLLRDLQNYPIFVYEIDGNIAGWVSISPYRANRRAYRKSKEVSFYLDSNYIGKGIGSTLLSYVIENRELINFNSLFAILISDNQPSINLLKKFDFSLWGLMPKVLEIDGLRKGASIYGRNFI